jgi:hypothetical protein
MCDKAGCNPTISDTVTVFDFLHLKLCNTHRQELNDLTITACLSQYTEYTRIKTEVEALMELGQFPSDAQWNTLCLAKSALWLWIKGWLAT